MKKRFLRLSGLMAIAVAVVMTFAACFGGPLSDVNRISEPFEWQDNLVRTATTLNIPNDANSFDFIGDDLVTFRRGSGTAIYTFDMARNSAQFTYSRQAVVLLGCEDTAFFIARQNNANQWALYTRGGVELITYGSRTGWLSNIEILGANHIRLDDSVYRVQGSAISNIIDNVSADVVVMGDIIFDASRRVVYNLNGDILYVAALSTLGNFVPLSADRGVYWRSIEVPFDTPNRGWTFSFNGRKYNQIVELVNFGNGNRSNISFGHEILDIMPNMAMPSEYRHFYRDRALSYSVVIARYVDNRVVTNRFVGVYVNDRFSTRATFSELAPTYRLSGDRFLAISTMRHEYGGVQLVDRRGNVLRFWSGSIIDPVARLCRKMGLIAAPTGFYDFDGDRVIDADDFYIAAVSYGYVIAVRERSVVAGGATEEFFELVRIDRNGAVTVITTDRQDATLDVEDIWEAGIMLVSAEGETDLQIRNFAGAVLTRVSDVDDVVYGDWVSSVGNVYVVAVVGEYTRVIRLSA